MHGETSSQEICPITLEAIPDGHAFVHCGTAFDATSLYTYLLQAPHLTNPVNRVPFTRPDLEGLQGVMQGIYGRDCIVRPSFEPDDDDSVDDDIVVIDTQDEEDWFDEVTLMDLFSTVIEERRDNTIRLRVELNIPVNEDDDETPSLSDSTGSLSSNGSLELPPSRIFNSLVDMYDDSARSRRLSDQLQLLQFLDFEAVDLVRRMLNLSDPDAFHNLVWSNTHVAIMESVLAYLRAEDEAEHQHTVAGIVVSEAPQAPPPSEEGEPPNFNLHVSFTDDWLIYRTRLQGQLRARYGEVMTDIRRLGMTHSDTSTRSHITMVREYAARFPQRNVQDTLRFIETWPHQTTTTSP